MKSTTEYRDSYCWFFGGQKQTPDSFEEMIRSKIAGTYVNVEDSLEVPQFEFEKKQREAQTRVTPNPANVIAANTARNSRKSIVREKSEQARKAKSARHGRNDGSRRAHFHSYGQGNVNPPNDDLFMTTFNVQAPTGVNPHTMMKSRIRPFVMSEYARPRPITAVQMHKPAFYASIKDAPRDEQLQMDGPFWMCWPSEKPFPEEYSALEKIVRPCQ